MVVKNINDRVRTMKKSINKNEEALVKREDKSVPIRKNKHQQPVLKRRSTAMAVVDGDLIDLAGKDELIDLIGFIDKDVVERGGRGGDDHGGERDGRE